MKYVDEQKTLFMLAGKEARVLLLEGKFDHDFEGPDCSESAGMLLLSSPYVQDFQSNFSPILAFDIAEVLLTWSK